MEFEEEEDAFDEKEAHKHFAITLFNKVWDLMLKKDRSFDDDELMVHAAHTSAYHWLQVGTELNFQRSAWQIARVYTLLGNKQMALHYAQQCYDLTTENDLQDFDLAFSFEALARAFALNGMKDDFDRFHQLALEASEHIADEEDKDVFEKDFAGGPWFGMK